MASFATQVQIRRGTEAENDAFTGAEGEVTMDLTNKQLRVHDGQTTGGMKIPNINDVAELKQTTDGMIDYVVETQEPTSTNGYTWYRLYKSGWVEQGGIIANLTDMARIVFPIIMADKNYTILAGQYVDSPNSHYWYVRQDIGVNGISIKSSAETVTAAYWRVSGYAA